MTWDKCKSCALDGVDGEYFGVLSLEECKEECIATEGCTAIEYGKNDLEEECYLKYGKDWIRKKNNDLDAHLIQLGIEY